MYYLQSRYYDPVIGRFINADGVAYLGADGTLLGYNLFVYCGNNPVMGYDPTGYVNRNGVFAGIAIGILAAGAIALTVVTAGAATPLVASAVTTFGTVVSAALVEASVITTVGAIDERPVVYDVTFVGGKDRIGISLVYDFGADTSETYLHSGRQSKDDLGVTFGTGFVYNYKGRGTYGGEFYDVSMSVDYKGASLGFDFCTDPGNLTTQFSTGCSAFLLTSGFSVPSFGPNRPVVAMDYYWPV